MARSREHLKPVFGLEGELVGYLKEGTVTEQVVAYDAHFHFLGAAPSVGDARTIVVNEYSHRARARLLRVGR
jgi:inosine/xanthosine triphosphate pyrophosphatase family protein